MFSVRFGSIIIIAAAVLVGPAAPAFAGISDRLPDVSRWTAGVDEQRGGPGFDMPRRGAVVIAGKLVPAEQVGIAEKQEDSCPTRHLHPQQGDSVTAFDGTVIPDPDPFGCGYGKLENFKPVQVFQIDIPDVDFDGIPDSIDQSPTNPDWDGDGLPDGAEDGDGDGLSDAFELWVTRTNIRYPDSDGNGNDDSVDFVLSTWSHRHVTIPVIINMYAGSGSVEDALETVEKSNLVLKQARVRLHVVAVRLNVNAGDDGSGGGTAGDGVLTDQEFRKAVEAGRLELASLTQKRGFKIAMAQLELNGQNAAGASFRRVPVVAVSPFNRTIDQIGATIAHEFFHTATIDGHPEPGSPEDTPGNVMKPFDEGRDAFVDSTDPDQGIENLILTGSQKEFVWGDGIPSLYGKPGTRKSPAVKREYQRGSTIDSLGDYSGPSYLDIHAIDIASHADDEDIHILLVLGGAFPDSGDVDAVFRLRFDVDDDIMTGEIAEIPGVDSTITIFVERNTETSGLVVGAELSSVDPAGKTLLVPTPQLLTVERIADLSAIPNLDIVDLFELHVPKDLLELTAANVPTSVASFEGAFSLARDVCFVDFDRELWLNDPTLWVPIEDADRGENVPFFLTGLTPGGSYELFLDDTLVSSGILDASGDDAGDFTVPALQPYDFCFLTAIDDAGLIAASAMEVADDVFKNGFETGNSSLWTVTVP